MKAIHRFTGIFLGLAAGDALGTTLEFGPRRPLSNLHTEMTGGGVFRLQPGEWTDDTAMAVALAQRPRAEVSASGFYKDTLEAALWAVATTSSFEDAVVAAVNLGADADTVGAVAGQLAGAVYGLSAIPERWLAPLAWRAQLIQMAEKLITN